MSATPPPERPQRSRARRVARIVGRSVAGLLVLLVVVIGAGAWLLGREATLQRIVAEVEKRLDGQLAVTGLRGSIYDRVEFERLVFRTKTQVITVDNGTLRYGLEPIARRFTIREGHAERLTVETIAKDDEPAREPETLEIPASVRIDTLNVDDVRIDAIVLKDGEQTTTLTDASLKGRYATEGLGRRWTIERIAVVTPWGRASGQVALAAARPFALDATLLAEGKVADVPYRAPLTISGALGDLHIVTDFTVSDPQRDPVGGHLDAHVLPFREQPIDAATLHVAGVSPKKWKAGLPDADLTLDARIVPTTGPSPGGGTFPFRAMLALANARPGPIDRQLIPLASLKAEVVGDSLGVSIDGLTADLGAAGRLSGKGKVGFDGASAAFDGKVQALDLRAIQTTLIATRFAGPLAVTRNNSVIGVETSLADAGRSVRFKGDIDGTKIAIADAHVAVGGSRIDAKGRVDLARDRPFALEGNVVHLDPKDFGDFRRADVTAAFKVDGKAGANATRRDPQRFDVNADVRIAPSRVLDRPIAGTAIASVAGSVSDAGKVAVQAIDRAQVALAFGSNRVDAHGAFGRASDRLDWTIDAPRLTEIGLGLGGSLKGHGVLAGSFAQPSIDFDLAGDALRYASAPAGAVKNAGEGTPAASTAPSTASSTTYSVRSLRGKGTLLAGEEGKLDADLSIVDFRDGAGAGPATVKAAELRVRGTRGAHELTVTARSDRFDVSATAHGGLDAKTAWHGSVDTFQSRGRVPFALDRAAVVDVGAARVEVGAAHLRFEQGGTIDLDRLLLADQTLSTAGRASGFPLALATTLSRDFGRQVSTSLMFGATWDLRIGNTIDGTAHLFRESGNITFLTEPRITVDPETIDVSADIVANRVDARIKAKGRGLGDIDASLETRLSKRDGGWGLAGDAPLVLKGDVDIPDLRWLARLSGRPGLDVYGAMKVALTGRGTVGAPLLAGHASGEAIGVRWPDQGLNFRDGKLDVDFEGNRIVLKSATLAAGAGTVSATGDLVIADRQMSGTLAVKLDKFEAVSRTDRTIVVSGKGDARFGPRGIDVSADLKADRGVLQLVEQRGPTVSDDVVVIGRDNPPEEAPARSVPVRFALRFDMGDDFKVKGSGFEGKLGGTISLTGTGTDLRATGTVGVREGVYVAYGQTLTVTRGNLTFSGPIDNPALDILAVRKNLAVEAGVAITGTALAPQARLTSNPEVPDAEKLSWLVLGHGLSATSKSDLGLLTTAAASLLGSSDSAGIQARIAATLGVDEIGVSGLGGDTGGLLTVGKQISSRLRVTFEQGLTKAATYLKVRYNIYQHVDLQLQTGTESAIDVFYTFTFD